MARRWRDIQEVLHLSGSSKNLVQFKIYKAQSARDSCHVSFVAEEVLLNMQRITVQKLKEQRVRGGW